MKTIIILLSLFISLASADIDFESSQLSELRDLSVKDHKKIFILISSNDCKYCSKQKDLINQNRSLSLKISEYDSFHINKDVEEEVSITVPVTPAIIIFNENNEELVRYYGYQDLDEMNDLLDAYINIEQETMINEDINYTTNIK